jgi:hypothetical protein
MNSNKDKEIMQNLIALFEKDCIELVQDPFGNYAIQFAFEIYGPCVCRNLLIEICRHILSLSMQKFSSNVVEKCIENADEVKFYLKSFFLRRL